VQSSENQAKDYQNLTHLKLESPKFWYTPDETTACLAWSLVVT